MLQEHSENLMVVIMKDIVQQSLPRILSIRCKLEKGDILKGSELEFLTELLGKINHCQQDNKFFDAHCMVIFTTVAHLLSEVIGLALTNEQGDQVPA